LSEKCGHLVVSIVFNDVLWDEFILLPFFFTVALCETDTRKTFLGPWLNKTEVYLTPFLVHKITQLQDNIYYLTLCKLSFEIQESSLSDITCLIQDVVSPHRGEKRMSRRCMRCPLSDFFFGHSWSYFDIQNLRLVILYNNIFIGKYYFNKTKFKKKTRAENKINKFITIQMLSTF
jgi:hypothetical protein